FERQTEAARQAQRAVQPRLHQQAAADVDIAAAAHAERAACAQGQRVAPERGLGSAERKVLSITRDTAGGSARGFDAPVEVVVDRALEPGADEADLLRQLAAAVAPGARARLVDAEHRLDAVEA